MKHDLIYDEFKEYEILWEGKKEFDDSFKKLDKYSYSHRFKFDNNYGASIVKHFGSYGFKEDLFELAVLKYKNKKDLEGSLCYDTPITDDVIGYLTNEDVLSKLKEIKDLEKTKQEKKENNVNKQSKEVIKSIQSLDTFKKQMKEAGISDEHIQMCLDDMQKKAIEEMNKQIIEIFQSMRERFEKYLKEED